MIVLPFALFPVVLGAMLLLRDLRFKRKALRRSGAVVAHVPFLHWASLLGASRELVAACRDSNGMEQKARTGVRLATRRMADTWMGKKIVLLFIPGNPPRVIAEKQLFHSGISILTLGLVLAAITLLVLV
ncbi:MAG: hypothetical protein JXO51_06410 [Candidatus Aminicenantes bacterium]|nr:hypothetical protein [Candidatus Aminicenantes bacterium]